jgi:hypothetical protein
MMGEKGMRTTGSRAWGVESHQTAKMSENGKGLRRARLGVDNDHDTRGKAGTFKRADIGQS